MYQQPALAALNDQSGVTRLINALRTVTNLISWSQTGPQRCDNHIDYKRFICYFKKYTTRGYMIQLLELLI